MNNKILPIGSIIKMHDNDKKIENDTYDYFCCIYPTGINGKEAILVKKEKIEKVIFIGYQDPKFVEFVKLLANNN